MELFKVKQCLQSAALFSDISKQEIEDLSKGSKQVNIKRGDAVFMQGDPSEALYLLQEGIIKISRVNTDGRKLTIDLIEAGQFFGELCLADEKERRSYAEAMVDSSYYELDKNFFETFLYRNPDFALKLIKLIGDRRLAMENLLEDMAFMEIPARIVALLVKYAENNIVKIPLTHQEMADLTGSTRVSVSRCLAKLRHEGCLETTGERIKLTAKALQLKQK